MFARRPSRSARRPSPSEVPPSRRSVPRVRVSFLSFTRRFLARSVVRRSVRRARPSPVARRVEARRRAVVCARSSAVGVGGRARTRGCFLGSRASRWASRRGARGRRGGARRDDDDDDATTTTVMSLSTRATPTPTRANANANANANARRKSDARGRGRRRDVARGAASDEPKKLWGGRFSEAQDPLMEKFNESLSFDRRLKFVQRRV